ncbi:MAG: hypothetical protein HYU66_02980, partial [Armatimonadetes bacterium]|nr:hypothetical protein [Armatimonadota bacterium]
PNPADDLATLGTRVDGERHTLCTATDYNAYWCNVAFCDGHAKYTKLTDTYDHHMWNIHNTP